MVDTVDSKSTAYKRGGSSPLQGRSSFELFYFPRINNLHLSLALQGKGD